MEVEASNPPFTFDERMAAVTRSIELYHPYLERYLNGMTQNHADTGDLLSKLWMYVLHRFKDQEIGEITLLRLKARQLFIDLYRQRRRSRIQTVEILPEPDNQYAGEEPYSEKRDAALKLEFWEKYPVNLPDRYKEALWLNARHGYTLAQIADKLDVPRSTVGGWVARVKAELAKILNDPTRKENG